MKTVEQLLQASKEMKKGNHRVEFRTNKFGDMLRVFFYYATPICTVNDTKNIFSIDDSYGTVSTKRACNAYRNELQYSFKEVEL